MKKPDQAPAMPTFVLKADDKAAPYALRAYADHAEALNMPYQHCVDARELAETFERWRVAQEPDA